MIHWIVPISIFALGYLLIILEHKLHIHKSAVALVMGVLLWFTAVLFRLPDIKQALLHSGAEIFELTIFLLAAMSLVEILIHYNLFDIIRAKILQLGLNDKQQFWIIATLTFILSAGVDNLTTTIVMIQIARKFFKGKNLLITVTGIVIAANAGGAWSPIGDVTTIMLWIAHKFTALDIITVGLLPALGLFLLAIFLLSRKIQPGSYDSHSDLLHKLTPSEISVIVAVFISFSLPLIMNLIGLPPYLGLLLGLGFVWLQIDLFKQFSKNTTHLETSLEKLIQKADIASIQFFVGILLAVSALEHFGILHELSLIIFGTVPSFQRIAIGNIILGLVSPILDNIPLTAIALKIIHTDLSSLWALLAITVGTGGSLLSIGSAPGVIAMGMVKELNFHKYLKIAFIPALLGFIVAIFIWFGEFLLLK